MNSNCFFFENEKDRSWRKCSSNDFIVSDFNLTNLTFFKDLKSIQEVLSKFENFQPLFIFVGFCSISRKKPWSIFQKFPNTLWFIFISYLFFDYRSEQIRHSHSSVWKSTQNTSRHFHLASIDFLSVIRYVQKRSLFNKSCYRGCLRDVNDKSPGVQFAMFVGNDNRCLLSI